MSRLLWLCLILSANLALAADEQPFGIDHRIPWTTSRVVGSPDPPLPYAVEQTFTKIKWKAPIFITPDPDGDSLFVVQQGGEKEKPSKILRVRDDPSANEVETFLEISNRLIYSFTFHPGYRTNGYLFAFTHGTSGELARTNYISRFTIERGGSHKCDAQSERTIIQWHSEGHDGGGIVFGHDAMLYISSGDGTSDSDGWVTGQDVSDLLGGILRIDVDHPSESQRYGVPKDNPFVALTNARPELWAYGLRNPWRLAIDRKTGRIWAGNNGQDLWETAHLIRRGENYGWSVYEGSHPFYLNRKRGPTPPVAPTIEHPHLEMRSLTGGEVYYGELLPELNGVYVYGDYSTGQIWGTDGDGSKGKRQLAESQLQITSFTVDHHGELLILDHAGAIYRLVRSPRQTTKTKFPTRLSDTGLFVSTKDHQVQPALIPYSVNAPGWTDGAYVERFMALPEDSRLGHLTNGAVLVQTLSLQREKGVRQRIETRLLTRQVGQWVGYSYRWNDDQSDATLVGANGEEQELVWRKAGSGAGGGGASVPASRQLWRFPSRAECMTCHSRAAEFVLGLNESQLNKLHDYGSTRDNQLRTLKHIGVFTGSMPKSDAKHLVNPYDSAEPLDSRVRSYLHVNCSVCHVEAGGGNSKMELGFTTKPERMNLIGARPQHDTFGIDNAMLVFPGDPGRSILLQRLSRRGRGQMPPLVSTVVDDQAVALFRDWIGSLKTEQHFVRDWKMEDLLPSLDQLKRGRSFESGRDAFRQTGCSQCHRFAGEGGSVGPDLNGVARRLSMHDLLESLILPSKVIAEGYAITEIELKSGAGEPITGRVEREDEQAIIIRPIGANEELVTIQKKDIRQRQLSGTSNMPAGIVNTLTEGQILDLLAYLISEGNSDHAAFQSPPSQP